MGPWLPAPYTPLIPGHHGPSPSTQLVPTYRSIEFAFAIHGHEESASNTKYAHYSSFHRGDFQQTYGRDTGIRGTKGCGLRKCVMWVLHSSRGSYPQCSMDPCAPVLLGGRRTPASCLTCCSMHHAGTSLLLAKYLFLHCPQASSSVAKVKISQIVFGAYETFVIMQLISPPWILLFQLDIRVTGPWG